MKEKERINAEYLINSHNNSINEMKYTFQTRETQLLNEIKTLKET